MKDLKPEEYKGYKIFFRDVSAGVYAIRIKVIGKPHISDFDFGGEGPVFAGKKYALRWVKSTIESNIRNLNNSNNLIEVNVKDSKRVKSLVRNEILKNLRESKAYFSNVRNIKERKDNIEYINFINNITDNNINSLISEVILSIKSDEDLNHLSDIVEEVIEDKV